MNSYYNFLKQLSWKTQHRFESKSKFHKFYGTKHEKKPFLNQILKDKINSNEPFMLARFGGVELRAALNVYHLNNRNNVLLDSLSYLINQKTIFWELTNKNMEMIKNNAGFFPNDYHHISLFQEKLFEDAKLLDILGVSVGLEHQVPTIPDNIDFSYIRDLEPWWFNDPWTSSLKGKKVLVIYPLDELIKSQYVKRDLLFEDSNILPDFDLKVYKPVQSIAENSTEFSTWFDALDKMRDDISKIDFDVAIIGAGAYGFSLAAEIKKMGKQSIQLGGITQWMFGIMGQRWMQWDHYKKLTNEHWVYPREIDKPKGFEKIENGCYW